MIDLIINNIDLHVHEDHKNNRALFGSDTDPKTDEHHKNCCSL